MSLQYTVRPISDRTPFTRRHEGSPFTAGWLDTLYLLEREIFMLSGKRVVIEVDVAERGIRSDGLLRADAKAASPAVRIAFESKYGPLVYATDRYTRISGGRSKMDDWQHNVRAIALGMEALRKVDRYGITKRGEQYRGFKALPSGSGAVATGMTTELALEVLRRETNMTADDVSTAAALAGIVRQAKARTHPDRNNGDRSRYDAVDQAEQVLRRAGRIA